MKKENQEDEVVEETFYSEMDKRSRKKSCCGWQTMIIFFFLLLVTLSFLTIYLYKEIKKINITFTKYYPSRESENSFTQKLSIDPSKNPTFSITITSEELTSVSSEGIKTFAFEMENVQTAINPKSIIVFGKMTKPLRSDLEIQTLPNAENSKIVLKVEKLTAGKLTLPNFLSSEIEKTLNSLMDENFKKLYENYQVEKIELKQDEMVISGKLK